MKIFTDEQHLRSLIRRRIKFVVEKGAMARLFKSGITRALQQELYHRISPTKLAGIQTRDEYDKWLLAAIESSCWEPYSQNGLDEDRWGYFAKLINIVIYEILANRELFSEPAWKRLRPFLHVPIDRIVTEHLTKIDPEFRGVSSLKGMTKKEYLRVQDAVRALGELHGVPPIWFEAAWAADETSA
ncbi:MAG: hypothetical protein QOF78_4146 [Phycisphaerales bacterium]|jgi:hypothetical protein|nr:hypothetical protein [Phycisphaerales bacterium]